MKVFGVMLIRDEADIIRLNIEYHLALGIDRLLIVDNGSSDGTQDELSDLSRGGAIEWSEDPGPYFQPEITTRLAQWAIQQGADWVLPIDADEFFYAPDGDFRGVLRRSTAGALGVELTNFIQARNREVSSRDCLLTMTRRSALPIGPLTAVQDLVETRTNAFVEVAYPCKWISRPTAELEIARGNHSVTGMKGATENTDDIVCLHAPLRARSILELKATHGRRLEALDVGPKEGWHVKRWRMLADAGELDQEWRSNSYADDHLDVYGASHRVVFDPTLRDAVGPFIRRDRNADVVPRDALAERESLQRAVREQVRIYRHLSRDLEDRYAREIRVRDHTIQSLQDSHVQEISKRDRTVQELRAELLAKVADRDNTIIRLQQEMLTQLKQRDEVIVHLQGELQQQVGDRDKTVLDLQAELYQKTTERDEVILNLQAELQQKVGDRDKTVRDLQAELYRKTAECDEIVLNLQAELLQKVGDRDKTVLDLQAELYRKTTERDEVIRSLQAELQRKVADRDSIIRGLQQQLAEFES